MIYLGSRYQDAPVYYMLDGRTGRTNATVMRPRARVSMSRTVTRWQDGMRLDLLSSDTYGNPERWWAIMDENPDVLDPRALGHGQVIRLP